MEEEDSRIQSGCKTFRMGSDLCEILLKEYHSTPESYKDVRIRFEDGSVNFLHGKAIEILAPGSNAKCLRQFLDGVFDPHLRSGNLEDGDFEDIIETFGFDAPPQVKSRLRAYYCEDCDSFMAKTSILSHIREFHPKSRTSISSPIWSYFDSTEHPEYHQCKECKSIIKDKTTNTSALIRQFLYNILNYLPLFSNALEMQHPDSYEEYLIQAATNEPEVSSPIPTNTATTLERPSFKRRSIVWNYFSLSHLDPKSSSCNFCNKAFKYIGQTSSMIRHLKSEHADEYADYAQSTLMVIPETYKIESPETDNSDDEMMDCEDVVPVSTGMPQADEALFEEAKSSKKNLIWGYYERIDETDEFMCNNCDQIIDLKRKSVSDMIKHLKMEHPLLYYELTASSLSNYDKGLGISIKMGNDDEDSDGGRMDSYVEEEEEELETDEDDGDIYLPPNKRSLAWLYFETTEVNGINSCNLCSRLFKCKKNNTSIMLRHLKRAHPEVHLETKGKSKISTSRKNDEEKNLNNGKFDEEFEYFVDLFIPTEDDIALRECKACFKNISRRKCRWSTPSHQE
ncbi:unnamed protein product [Lepeophtheirus salmonis]|uniref:(salmon louse) hypothetical protein n=1 Tax=Lepeophtheirus salmonis TaxID=72036 RepID=A0A7R8CFP5_LEPSM|nr:unnamed protein product [Lepeophtheirus salmonis]CAF2808427.1 unnamed protein product [Lepeophtheirus salmonis]